MRSFLNRSARRVFFILVSSFILLTIASYFSINGLKHVIKVPKAHPNIKVARIIKTIDAIKATPDQQVRKVIRALNTGDLRISLTNKPLTPLHTSLYLPSTHLHKWLKQHINRFHYSFSRNNGQFINLSIFPPHRKPWLISSFILMLGLIMLMTIFILYWSVEQLTTPLTKLVYASQQLSADVTNASPIATTDNHEINEVIAAFNRLQVQVKNLLNNRTQMLAAISHDLRTPITRLKLRIESLENNMLYEKMLGDLTEMENMIFSTLAFIRDDHFDEAMEWFDLNALLVSICDDMTDLNYEVTYSEYHERLPYFGQLNALKRALNNIINNAVKYGQVANIYIKKQSKIIQLTIEDCGPGIPDSDLKKVFEPFYRLEQSRNNKTGGTGLGLVIAKDIICAHGGTIQLTNMAQKGLKVTIILPSNNSSNLPRA